MKRIGVLTSGGDAPGMNAAVRSVVRIALDKKLEVIGIKRGYSGLIQEELQLLTHRSVSNIISLGGTMLKTSRCPEFHTREGQQKAVEVLKNNHIDGLVVIGGNGSYHGAVELWEYWHVPCVGVPGTIDNDVNGTDFTIGSDTALDTAMHSIDRIRDTVSSLERIFIVEVMGRHCGYIALSVALAGGAEQVVIPERPFDVDQMCQEITEGYIKGKASWLIIVAEGVIKAHELEAKIKERTDLEVRSVVLGHVQRGGCPTAKDRILATELGAEAVRCLLREEFGVAVGVQGENCVAVPLREAIQKKQLKTEQICSLIRILT